jgi:hypothetical protein
MLRLFYCRGGRRGSYPSALVRSSSATSTFEHQAFVTARNDKPRAVATPFRPTVSQVGVLLRAKNHRFGFEKSEYSTMSWTVPLDPRRLS